MKNYLVLFLLALLSLSSCTQKEDTTGDRERLIATIDSFYKAIETGDDDARIGLFDDSAIMMPAGRDLIKGRADIARVIKSGEGNIFRLKDVKIVDFDLDGNIAYTINTYYYTYHPEGGEEAWKKTKNIHIWKKQPDGSWKLHADIWNSSE